MASENIRNVSIAVDTTNVVVSEDMTGNQRKLLTLVNTSPGAQIISLGFGQEAIAGQGIALYPTGTYSETLDARFTPTNARISAISSAAGGTLAVHERILTL